VRRRADERHQRRGADDKARLKLLEREVKELRRANEILRKASAYFAMAELDRREMMMAFIDAHREDLGIEPICRELAIAPSSYHEHALRLADPGKRPARARSDEEMRGQIKRVHEANLASMARARSGTNCGASVAVAKCTVER
jgi:hypothetical protein